MRWKYIVDGVALILLLVPAAAGYRKGLLKTLIGMSSLIVSLLAAYFFAPFVSDFLVTRTKFDEKVSAKVVAYLENAAEKDEEEQSEKDQSKEEQSEKGALENLLSGSVWKRLSDGKDAAVSKSTKALAEKITNLIVKATAVLLVLIAAYLVLRILLMVTGVIEKLPLIRTVNKAAGGLLGLIRGLLLTGVLCVIVTVIAHSDLGMKIIAGIGDSFIMKYIYSGALLLLGL